MKNNDEGSELYKVVRSVCDSHADRPSLNPIWIANEAMTVIDFDHTVHELGYIGCHLQFRQIARSFCRRAFTKTEEEEEDFFPDTLQDRYPVAPGRKGEEPQYILRELMTDADYTYNVDRIRKGGNALLRHADALEAEQFRRHRRVA